MARPEPIAAEELLAHAGWMRALAARLVRDEASADDVLQESMLSALRSPPKSAGPVAPWLSRVVRHVASNLRRTQARSEDRIARQPVPPTPQGPAETLERLDTQQMMVELVRALPEPARSTVVLRYFEGLTSPQIAARMNISDATVRWRLRQALTELRSRLEKRYGSREAWCALLLPLAAPHSMGAAALASGTAGTGVIAMAVSSKLVVAAAVVGIAGAGLWASKQFADAPPRDPPAVVTLPPVSENRPTTPIEAPPEPASGRVEVEQATSQLLTPSPAPAALPATEAKPLAMQVRARFVDELGQPWANVLFHEANDREIWARSGLDGRVDLKREPKASVEWSAAIGHNVQFVAEREGCATRAMRVQLQPGATVDLGEIVLSPGGRVQGRVHDANGRPLSGAMVGLAPAELDQSDPGKLRRQGHETFERSLAVLSNERGEFDLDGAAAGRWRLWGTSDDRGFGVREAFELAPGEHKTGLDFEIPAYLPADRILGRVVDPDGAPVPSARVAFSYTTASEIGSSNVTANESGVFEIVLMREVECTLIASDPSERFADVSVQNVQPGAEGVVLQLGQLTYAQVRVLGLDGKPVRNVQFKLRTGAEMTFQTRTLGAKELEPGLYQFPTPGVEFGLEFEAAGFLPGDEMGLDSASLPTPIVVTMEPAPVLRGQVLSMGKPVPGALVEAQEEVPRASSMLYNHYPCLLHPYDKSSTRTDEAGHFAIELISAKPMYLRASAPGLAPKFLGPVSASDGAREWKIELDSGGAIEGRVLDKSGQGAAGAIVGITNGDGHPRTTRAGLQGTYRFEGVAAGSWLVRVSDAEIRDDSSTMSTWEKEQKINWSCTVTAGTTTRFDVQPKP